MKIKVKKIIRLIYGNMPFNENTKNKIKNFIYKSFSVILKDTEMYKIWKAQLDVNGKYTSNFSDIPKQVKLDENEYKNLVMTMYLNSHKKSSEFIEYNESLNVNITKEDTKLIAFYLPQFHSFKENDNWWGRGFTEWTNVTKAVPQFVGHHQPQLPIDVGFYDTRLLTTQKRQIELAKKYGIFGFCFHYYWFSGKRLMDKPLELFLDNKDELDFPFCICWANENWTRRWDGMESDVLIAQKHLPEDDLNFIKDMEVFLRDDRYIKIDGKPIVIVYRPQIIPNAANTFEIWREYCRTVGIGEIYIVGAKSFGFDDPESLGMDAEVEFPPHAIVTPEIKREINILNKDFDGYVFDLQYYIKQKDYLKKCKAKRTFRTVFPAWDNTARKPNAGHIFYYSSPALYKEWLVDVIRESKENPEEERFVFINAWNEWAEGAHLEPDRKYGYAHLQATAEAIIESRDI